MHGLLFSERPNPHLSLKSPMDNSPPNSPPTTPSLETPPSLKVLAETQEENPKLPLPLDRLAAVEQSAATLAEVVNANGTVMRDCLEVTEARQWMIMRAFDDMIAGGPKVTLRGIDWEHYKQEYIDYAQAQAEMKKSREEKEEDDVPKDAVVFGGG